MLKNSEVHYNDTDPNTPAENNTLLAMAGIDLVRHFRFHSSGMDLSRDTLVAGRSPRFFWSVVWIGLLFVLRRDTFCNPQN